MHATDAAAKVEHLAVVFAVVDAPETRALGDRIAGRLAAELGLEAVRIRHARTGAAVDRTAAMPHGDWFGEGDGPTVGVERIGVFVAWAAIVCLVAGALVMVVRHG